MDGILNTDTYYTMEGIMTSLGRGGRPGLAGAGKGYISYQLEGKHISVGKQYAGHKIALAFTGITTDLEGFQLTRKANALAAVTASACCKRCQQRRQRPFCYGRYYTGVAARLTQAASIPEDLTDNELDEVLNAKTSFNKRVITDLQADKWVTRDLRLISG
jgi:hypothetical protein